MRVIGSQVHVVDTRTGNARNALTTALNDLRRTPDAKQIQFEHDKSRAAYFFMPSLAGGTSAHDWQGGVCSSENATAVQLARTLSVQEHTKYATQQSSSPSARQESKIAVRFRIATSWHLNTFAYTCEDTWDT